MNGRLNGAFRLIGNGHLKKKKNPIERNPVTRKYQMKLKRTPVRYLYDIYYMKYNGNKLL